MGQNQVPLSYNTPEEEMDSLIADFKHVKEEQGVRKVRLRVQVSGFCGCGGGGEIEIYRIVGKDSELQDGDEVDDVEAGDMEA